MNLSELKFYSFGRVANNAVLTSSRIQVIAVEVSNFLDGDVVSIPVEEVSEGVDASGQTYSDTVQMDNALAADWLPLNSHSALHPQVRRGERVLLWKFADSPELYWSDLGLDQKLRRVETMILAVNANPDPEADGRDPANCYMIEVSAHNKSITLNTTMKNGEYCEFTAQFNLAEGQFNLLDNVGQILTVDAKERLISFTNADGTHFALDKKDITGYAPKDITMAADNDIGFVAGGNVSIGAGSNLSTESGGATSVKAGSSLTTDSGGSTTMKAGGSFTAQASSIKLDAADTEVTGNFRVRGSTTLNGGSSTLPFRGPNNSI